MRFKIFLEYDGTRYSGWQKQNNAKTIQGTLIRTVQEIFDNTRGKDRYIDLQGAGRTDAGVHAIEQVAHLDCETMLAPEILKIKMNDELPSDINILNIEKTAKDFHARHSAVSRQYLFRISKRRSAFEKKYVWWIRDKLNVEAIKSSSALLEGMHDFSSFSEADKENKSTKVLLEDITVHEEDDLILIRIKASHFLWKMVRRIVGTLVEAGRGNISEDNIKNLLENSSNEISIHTAPPSGLFLEKIYYK
ncbi:MAG: tRNA pseudouridine(38-40) synthase TruA [Ignavibacteria bacterium]